MADTAAGLRPPGTTTMSPSRARDSDWVTIAEAAQIAECSTHRLYALLKTQKPESKRIKAKISPLCAPRRVWVVRRKWAKSLKKGRMGYEHYLSKLLRQSRRETEAWEKAYKDLKVKYNELVEDLRKAEERHKRRWR